MPPRSPVQILFVGDMHLGRRASRIPDRAGELGGFAPADISPAEAWRRTVQRALDLEVQAVALAGDLVHQDDDLFEAGGLLEQGLRQLNAAGIQVVAVAGNHDTKVLPALAKVVEGLRLLGPDGTWTTCAVTPEVRLAGWSFPARHHSVSPLRDNPPAAEAGVVTLGLLHGDLDAARSDYAPVSSTELAALGYDGWALGHVHAPDPVPDAAAPRRPFYLGSISGTTPNETGAHGPVLATIGGSGDVRWQRLVLAPLRWEHLDLAADTLPVVADPRELKVQLAAHLLNQVSRWQPDAAWAGQDARALGLRLTLTGIHAQAEDLAQALDAMQPDDLVTLADGRAVFIEKITCAVQLPVDLDALATRADPPGLLAREILALGQGDPASEPLLAQARQAVAAVNTPAALDEEPWTDAELRAHLIRAGQRALTSLLSQDNGEAS